MEFVTCGWIIFAMFMVILLSKLLAPELSYEIRSSLIVSIIGAIFFAHRFISNIDDNFNLWPLICCVICCIYIYNGGKTVAFKTVSGVFSTITKKPVGTMYEGTNWADPIFEVVTISPDGIPNKSADLQELHIKILETPLMQTKTRGIQAKVKNISFMLHLTDEIRELLKIEGGAKTIRERIVENIEEFFLEQISQLSPEDLDQDKMNTIHKLANDLKKETNKFCEKNNYPYEIIGNVIIADTELEAKYYEVLAKEEFARHEQKAKDLEAVKLRERIAKFGKHNLPNGTEKEQTDYALIALGIVKKDIQERKYAIDSELVKLAKDIADHLKK